MRLDMLPERYFSTKQPELLQCQRCNNDDIQFRAGGNTPSSCEYIMCNGCKSKVAGYGKERLIIAWNDFQKQKIRL